jgi:hypothetical protein
LRMLHHRVARSHQSQLLKSPHEGRRSLHDPTKKSR